MDSPEGVAALRGRSLPLSDRAQRVLVARRRTVRLLVCARSTSDVSRLLRYTFDSRLSRRVRPRT